WSSVADRANSRRWHSLQRYRPSSVREFAYIAGRPSCTLHRFLYDGHHMPRTAPRAKEVTHERIVEAAARAIRRSGYDGTSVADIMKEAGLTTGGFYAHFASREAMLAEAADRAGAEAVAAAARVAATAPPEQALQRLLHAYLS